MRETLTQTEGKYNPRPNRVPRLQYAGVSNLPLIAHMLSRLVMLFCHTTMEVSPFSQEETGSRNPALLAGGAGKVAMAALELQ